MNSTISIGDVFKVILGCADIECKYKVISITDSKCCLQMISGTKHYPFIKEKQVHFNISFLLSDFFQHTHFKRCDIYNMWNEIQNDKG